MNSKEAREYLKNNLIEKLNSNELDTISWRVLEHLSGERKLSIITDHSIVFEASKLENICEQLHKDKPLQYILGYEWWGNMKIKVDSNVLIPRPETEELSKMVVDYLSNKQNQIIIDLGTGSGCIPIYIKKNKPDTLVYALDISPDALQIAHSNAIEQQVDIHFLKEDMLNPNIVMAHQFDIIISNPPYILPSEKEEMQTRVWAYEPNIALFVTNQDAMQFYKSIAQFAKQHLKEDGNIFVELNQSFSSEVKNCFEDEGFHCKIMQDMYGNDRFGVAWKSIL